MAEETGNQTATETVTETVTESVQEQSTTTEATAEVVEEAPETTTEGTADTTTEPATNPFSKEDLDWQDLGISDEEKDKLVASYSGWFKDKDAANAFLKATAEANKTNKANQAKKIQDLEAGWEKSLKTDADFGKDYEGNKKRVAETLSKFSSESDMAEFEKFGYTKFPAFNRMVLKFAKEIEDARIAGKGQPEPSNKGELPVDRFGRTMFDFSKKQ